jgi:proteasome lid subunit RPN8/RPN11
MSKRGRKQYMGGSGSTRDVPPFSAGVPIPMGMHWAKDEKEAEELLKKGPDRTAIKMFQEKGVLPKDLSSKEKVEKYFKDKSVKGEKTETKKTETKLITSSPPSPKFVLPRSLGDRIMRWARAADGEVSGLGVLKVDVKKGEIELVRVDILKQVCTGASTELDDAAVAKYLFERDQDHQEVRFWWHSHADMGVFWSGTDTEMMRTLTKTWGIALVVNKKGEKKLSLVINDPISMFTDLPVENEEDWDTDPAMKQAHDDVQSLVRSTWVQLSDTPGCSPKAFDPYGIYGGYGYESYQGMYDWDKDDEKGGKKDDVAQGLSEVYKDDNRLLTNEEFDTAKRMFEELDEKHSVDPSLMTTAEYDCYLRLEEIISENEFAREEIEDANKDMPDLVCRQRAADLIQKYNRDSASLTDDEKLEFNSLVQDGFIIFPEDNKKGKKNES